MFLISQIESTTKLLLYIFTALQTTSTIYVLCTQIIGEININSKMLSALILNVYRYDFKVFVFQNGRSENLLYNLY